MSSQEKTQLFNYKKNDITADAMCYVAKTLKIMLSLIFILILVILLPVLPFIWISYKGFHGRYGIVNIIKDVTKIWNFFSKLILMPFATLDEAWGDIKPYINYNPILNQNNSNVEQTTTKMETIRVNEPTIQNNANTDEKLNNLENNIEKNNIDLKNEIVKLNNKIEKLIRSNNKQVNAITNNDFLTKNMNDILLFMIFGLFIMLLMDLFYKIICSKISRK